MKHFALFQLLVIAILMISGCAIDKMENDSSSSTSSSSTSSSSTSSSSTSSSNIIVEIPEWTYTKASVDDILYPELKEGEKVAVLNEDGILYPYTIVECGKHRLVLDNPDVELVEGMKYRVQYPYPDGRESPFIFFMYFGDYDTEAVSWLVSDWKKFKKDETLRLVFKQLSSVLAFNLTAPFDCVVDEVRLHTDKCMFCIKGAFNSSKDNIFPERTTWVTSLGFSQRGMVWEKGKDYKIYLTVWPEDFSKENYSLDIYTEDDRGASAAVSLPNVKEGRIVEFEVDDFDILVSPVTKKDVIEQGRSLDEVDYEIRHFGENYR